MAYYAGQSSRDLDADSLGRRARVLHLMGELRDKRGDLPGALTLFRQAAESTATLLARSPDDAQRVYDHAQSVYWLGYLAERRGDLPEATAEFEDYRQLANRLPALAPRRDDWGEEAADADYDLGVVLLEQNRSEQAAAAFTAAEAMFDARARQRPADRDRQYELAQAHAQLSDTEKARGRLGAAMSERLAERSILAALHARRPDDAGVRYSQAVNRIAVGRLLLAQDRPREALAELGPAGSQIDQLLAAATDVVDYRQASATCATLTGESLLRVRDFSGAAIAAGRARTLAERLAHADPAMIEWRGRVLGGARVLEIKVTLAEAANDEARREALAPAPAEASRLLQLVAEQPHDRALARIAAEAELLAGDLAWLQARVGEARSWWGKSLETLEHAGADGPDKLDAESQTLMVEAKSRRATPPGAPHPNGGTESSS